MNQRFLIVGGTGTLGQATAKALLNRAYFVTVFSRCELKQKEMQIAFNNNPALKFILGDIRDRDAVLSATRHVDCIMHFAALKHVDTLEEFPEEALKTNVLGTINIADAAEHWATPNVVFSSTDKAVDPINAYGFSKALAEKILMRRNLTQAVVKYSIYRWGNVLGSRGSAIHGFVKTLREEKKVYITDPKMTRFWIKIEDAVSFMLKTYDFCDRKEIQIPSIYSASIAELADAVARALGVEYYETVTTGIRAGEKIHESLTSEHFGGLTSFSSERIPRGALSSMVKEAINE